MLFADDTTIAVRHWNPDPYTSRSSRWDRQLGHQMECSEKSRESFAKEEIQDK